MMEKLLMGAGVAALGAGMLTGLAKDVGNQVKGRGSLTTSL